MWTPLGPPMHIQNVEVFVCQKLPFKLLVDMHMLNLLAVVVKEDSQLSALSDAVCTV